MCLCLPRIPPKQREGEAGQRRGPGQEETQSGKAGPQGPGPPHRGFAGQEPGATEQRAEEFRAALGLVPWRGPQLRGRGSQGESRQQGLWPGRPLEPIINSHAQHTLTKVCLCVGGILRKLYSLLIHWE